MVASSVCVRLRLVTVPAINTGVPGVTGAISSECSDSHSSLVGKTVRIDLPSLMFVLFDDPDREHPHGLSLGGTNDVRQSSQPMAVRPS